MLPSPDAAHRDLTSDRLLLVGEALRQARDGAQRDARPEIGDDSWTTGCVAFRRSCKALVALAAEHPWLVVIDPGMEFWFLIGEVPFRFFHETPSAPSPRQRAPLPAEAVMLQRVFPFAESAVEVFRLTVETDKSGYVSAVTIVRLLGGSVVEHWPIWTRPDEDGTARTDGEDLGPPDVSYDGGDDEQARPTGTDAPEN